MKSRCFIQFLAWQHLMTSPLGTSPKLTPWQHSWKLRMDHGTLQRYSAEILTRHNNFEYLNSPIYSIMIDTHTHINLLTYDIFFIAVQSKAIITKYLSTSGKSLGSAELNSIGTNLCSLDTSTLKIITPDSIRWVSARCSKMPKHHTSDDTDLTLYVTFLFFFIFRNANPLNVASCSSEQKRILYDISNVSYNSLRENSSLFYNLIKNTLGKKACYVTLSGCFSVAFSNTPL